MAKIRARIVGGAPGQVSLAQDEDAEGRVSLAPPEPAGQLSLPDPARPEDHGE
jgi:hypothetical protein